VDIDSGGIVDRRDGGFVVVAGKCGVVNVKRDAILNVERASCSVERVTNPLFGAAS
jgi:hypothetical protein